MTASVASATVRITPDLTALGADIRAAIATELRRVADELSGLDAATPPEEPTPRYILIRDRVDDFGILDTELDTYVDYATEDRGSVDPDIERLNAGTLQPSDLGRAWRPTAKSNYAPFLPVNVPAEPRAVPRFVLVRDSADDLGIRDNALGVIADFETEDRAEVDPHIARLNAGEIGPSGYGWTTPEDGYPPYTVVDA